MIKMLTAFTTEPDEAEIALEEIGAQLELGSLMKNSAGFITCSYDFIETGILTEICAAMPFDVVGCTTLTGATNRGAGTVFLCLTVLTSDECRFSTALSEPLTESLAGAGAAYREAASKLQGKPALALAFMPLVKEFGGELILNELDRASEGTPIMGTIGCDHDTGEYSNTHTFRNGVISRTGAALLLVDGEISPEFFVASASEDKVQKQKAIITKSDGSVLQEVNNVSALQYLKDLNLTKGDGLEGMSAIPFIVNYNDGTQAVARAIYMLTPEGYAVCGGAMPVNATLSIGSIDYDDVLLTARETLERVLETGKRNGLILFPCLGRNLVLGTDIFAETDAVQQCIGDSIPFHLAYSGGEVCPVYDADGVPRNRFHNFTFVACVF